MAKTSEQINELVNRMIAEPGKSPFDEMVIDALIVIRDWHQEQEEYMRSSIMHSIHFLHPDSDEENG